MILFLIFMELYDKIYLDLFFRDNTDLAKISAKAFTDSHFGNND